MAWWGCVGLTFARLDEIPETVLLVVEAAGIADGEDGWVVVY